MSEKKENKKYTFTVEGETECWYLEWLKNEINSYENSDYSVSIRPKVQPHPIKFAKNISALTTPRLFHLCDVESKNASHEKKFKGVLSELKEATEQKGVKYDLGYSNFTFELWMILHKIDCNGPLADRSQYLERINKAYKMKFETIADYKKEENFKKCLSMLCLEDVKTAIKKSEYILDQNKETGKKEVNYKGYTYYIDNPSLTVFESIKEILTDCGIIKTDPPSKNRS